MKAITSIGFIANGMSGPGSGAWSRLEAYVELLSNAGFRVVVATDDLASAASLRSLGITLVPVDHPGRLARMAGRQAVAEALVYEQGVDVLHLETPPFKVIGLPVPVIATVHDLRYFYPGSRWWQSGEGLYMRLIERRHIQAPDRVLTVSQWTKRDIVRFLHREERAVTVVPNVSRVPTEIFEGDASPSPMANPYVLALGHLEPRKNLEVLIRAKATDSWPKGVQLVMAGRDGGSLSHLAAIARELDVKVDFLGTVDESRKWSLIRDALCVALPSTIEGFGIVAVEAFSAGVPVVMSDATALSELAQSGFPTLPPHDEAAWARAVRRFAEEGFDPNALRFAKESIVSRYGPGSVLQGLLDLYQELGVTPVSTR